MPEEFKGEKIEKNLVTKQVWFYHDTETGIKQISKELFKKVDKVIHYPRGFEGGEKYKFIKKFTYLGFGGKLPIGVIKAVSYGWGFTKTLNPFSYFIDETYKVKEVIIEKKVKTELDVTNKILYLNETSLQELQGSFSFESLLSVLSFDNFIWIKRFTAKGFYTDTLIPDSSK